MTAEQLNDHIGGQFDIWRPSLDGLASLCRRLGVCRTWEEAAVLVRNSSQDALDTAVAESLRLRLPSLKALWTALAMEEYRDLPKDWKASMDAVGITARP